MIVQVAFYKGTSRLFNRAVSWWKRGPYSHCELVVNRNEIGESLCYSSSFQDGGVRRKWIDLKADHWDLVKVTVTEHEAAAAVQWFEDHLGQKYDVAGLVGFVWGPWAERPDHWFCNEAVGASLGVQTPWRFDPNALAALLRFKYWEVNKPLQ